MSGKCQTVLRTRRVPELIMVNSSLKIECENQRDHKHAQTAHKAGASKPVHNPSKQNQKPPSKSGHVNNGAIMPKGAG
jgi:hypothetical protein